MIYSLWVVLIALTFWFVKFDNNVTILQALMDTGRYPVSVYPAWLRLIVTFVVPIAVATTVPMQALRGQLGGWQVLLSWRRSGGFFHCYPRLEGRRAALQRGEQLILPFLRMTGTKIRLFPSRSWLSFSSR